jgi:hypothetical protein
VRVTLLQTNFTAGEISPRLYGRVDVARYSNGAKRIRNGIVLVHGGVLRRYGTRFVAEVKDSAKRGRLVPFVFNRQQAYVLELGDLYARFFKADKTRIGGGSPYEVATPYTEAQLFDIDYVQGADTMFTAHPSVPIQRVRRFADNNWSFAPAPFITEPYDEIGHRFAGVTLTLSAATVGTGRTCTASSGVFLPADVGRTIRFEAGQATITAYTSATVVTVEITTAFASVSVPATWQLEGSPRTAISASAASPVGGTVRLTLHGPGVRVVTATGPGTTVTFATATAHNLAVSDVAVHAGFEDANWNGLFGVASTPSATQYTATGSSAIRNGSGLGTVYKFGAGQGWRTDDVGKLVEINGGLIEITAFISASEVEGVIRQELTSTLAAPPEAWSLNASVWNATDGYPRTVTLYEQRLIAAGSPGKPQTLWGSRTGEYLNFERGLKDDDAFAFTLASDQVNPIAYVAPMRTLVALTYGGEFTVHSGLEKPLAPTNVQVRLRSNHGCAQVRPVRIRNEEIFVQRAGRKVRALAYNVSNDDYTSPDISVLAEHVTESSVVDMQWQQEPDPLLWGVRADGKFITCTFERDQDIVAWCTHDTDGAVESLAVIPDATGEQVWLLVRRTINGVTRRYVEVCEHFTYTLANGKVMNIDLDCAITGSNPAGQAVWTGLAHLEGKEVECVADGAYMGRFTVASGQITLPRTAKAVVIGLPFTMTVDMLTPEIQFGEGSAQGNSMRTGEVTVRTLDSIGGVIRTGERSQKLPTRSFGEDRLDQPPEMLLAVDRTETLGWDRGDSPLTIEQALPMPFHLLNVIRKFSVNT